MNGIIKSWDGEDNVFIDSEGNSGTVIACRRCIRGIRETLPNHRIELIGWTMKECDTHPSVCPRKGGTGWDKEEQTKCFMCGGAGDIPHVHKRSKENVHWCKSCKEYWEKEWKEQELEMYIEWLKDTDPEEYKFMTSIEEKNNDY